MHSCLDGVFATDGAGVRFHAAPAMTMADVADVLATIVPRVRRLLARRGLGEDDGEAAGEDRWTEEAPVLKSSLSSHAAVLDRVADGVFDNAIVPSLAAEFLTDRRHHLIVALDDQSVVGMITAVDYARPDKPAQLWINEVGVAPSYQRQAIGRTLLRAMLAHGRTVGWTEAWLGTEHDNVAARGLYEDAGSVAEPFVLYSFDLQR